MYEFYKHTRNDRFQWISVQINSETYLSIFRYEPGNGKLTYYLGGDHNITGPISNTELLPELNKLNKIIDKAKELMVSQNVDFERDWGHTATTICLIYLAQNGLYDKICPYTERIQNAP